MPADSTVTLTADGGAAIAGADGVALGRVESAWAFDANNAPVPTHFELDGTLLTQVVDHTSSGVAYPIVADPRVTWLWWGVAIKLTHAETVAMANNYTPAYITAAFCGFIPVPLGNVACGVAVGIRLWTWEKPIKDAASQAGRCAQLNAPYVGGVIAWNVTNESC